MAYLGNSQFQGIISGGNIQDGSIESIDLATLTNIDINSGSIDNTIIGANEAVAGNFSSIGIGTNSPNAGLQISKGADQSPPAAGSNTGAACFGNDTSSNAYGLVMGADGFGKGYISAQRTDGTATTYDLVIQPNGGNVGIGKTPSKALDVEGSIQTSVAFRAYDDVSGSNRNLLRYDSGNVRLETGTGGGAGVGIFTAGVQRLGIDGLGRIGIGTDNPVAKLHVWNPNGGNATDKATMLSEAVVKLQPHSTNSTNLLVAQVNSGNGMGLQVTNSSATADWDIALSPFGGNVGIGNVTPEKRLHVAGECIVDGGVGVGSTGTFHVRQKGDTLNDGIALTSSDSTSHRFWKNASGNLHIGPSSLSTALTQTLDGKLGIGVTDPSAQLNVGHASHGIGMAYLGSAAAPATAGLYTSSSAIAGGGDGYGSLKIQARSDYDNYGITFEASNELILTLLRHNLYFRHQSNAVYAHMGSPNVGTGTFVHVKVNVNWNQGSMSMFRITGFHPYSSYAETYMGSYQYSNSGYRYEPYGQIIANQGNHAAGSGMYNTASDGKLVLVINWPSGYTAPAIEHIGAGNNYGDNIREGEARILEYVWTNDGQDVDKWP